MADLTNRSGTFDVGGDLTVHRLGFGGARITDGLGAPADPGAVRDVLRRAVELGVDFFDTADSYGPCASERLLGEALADEDAVVATKTGLLRNPDGDWIPHGDPDYVRNQVLCSLDRLGVDAIDLYQHHRPDPDVPYEETVHAFAELKDEGLVDHVGVSNVTVEQLETARDIVEVATVQNPYSVANREHEDVLDACEAYGIGFVPYYPLGGGDLGAAAPVLDEVAAAHDATRYQVALAWLLEHSPVTLPIPGTTSPDHLADNVAASALSLTDGEMSRLRDAASVE